MKKYFIPLASLIVLSLPATVFGQAYTYEPLVGIPGVGQGEGDDVTIDLNDLLNALYAMSISIAALLAVIKIVIAGVKYMMTDVVTTKGGAKSDIQNAVLGLLVVIGAVLILFVINPDILNTPAN